MNSRQKRLLGLLSKEVTPAKVFSEILKVSTRTIYSDLEVLEPVLLSKGYRLNRVAAKGISIIKDESLEKHSLEGISEITLSPIERKLDIFKRMLFEKEQLRVNRLALDYSISESSIRDDLNYIFENFLGKNACVSARANGKTFLQCDVDQELNTHIHLCQYIYVNEEGHSPFHNFYSVYKTLYSAEIVDACLETIEQVEKENIFFLGDHYRTNLLIVLIVLTFLNKDQKGDDTPLNKELIDYKTEYDSHIFFTITILEEIGKKLDIKFSDDDLNYLVKYLRGIRISTIHPDAHDKSINAVIGDRILESISSKLAVDLSTSQTIRSQLIIHINSMLYRIDNDVIIKNALTEKIQEEYKVLFNALWLVLNEEIRAYYPTKKISTHEVAFIVIYLQTLLTQQKKNKKILVVCPNGISTSQLIVNELKEVLPPFDVIEVSSMDRLGDYNVNDLDLIVTTVDLDLAFDNIVKISPLINSEDIRRVTEVYTTKVIKKEKENNLKFDEILFLLKKELIIIDDGKDLKKKNVLKEMSEKLEEHNYCTKEYYPSILERENIGPTIINEVSASPHGSPKFVNKSTLGLYISKNGIKWDQNSVKIAIFPCISQTDIGIARNLFTEIYNMLTNEALMEEIFNAKSFDDVFEILRGDKK